MEDTQLTRQVRHLCFSNNLPTYPSTAGLAVGHIQANLVVLPAKYAQDFRSLCQRNPVPCPLIGESLVGNATRIIPSPGTGFAHSLFNNPVDIRTDLPKYNIYRGGQLLGSADQIIDYWRDDSVAFLIGCSYSFEFALMKAGLPPRHHLTSTAVPMYRTSLPLNPAGVFTRGTYVVSMRPYRLTDIPRVRGITAKYQMTGHGEPIAWGWDAVQALGIRDIMQPEWGTMVEFKTDEVPVFWGCGVTPQWVSQRSRLPLCITHAPGKMFVTDLKG